MGSKKSKSKRTPKYALQFVLGHSVLSNAQFCIDPITNEIFYAAGSKVVCIDPDTGVQKRFLSHNQHTPIVAMSVSSDGNFLIVVQGPNTKRCFVCTTFDLTTHKAMDCWVISSIGEISCIAMNSSNSKLCIGGISDEGENILMVYDMATGKPIVGTANDTILSACWIDDSTVVTGGDRTVRYWNCTDESVGFRLAMIGQGRKNMNAVVPSRFEPNGLLFISDSGDLCCLNNLRMLYHWMECRIDDMSCMAVNDELVVVGGANGIVRVFNGQSHIFLRSLPLPPPNDSYLNCTSSLFSTEDKELFPDVTALAVSNDSKRIIVAYSDCSIMMFDDENNLVASYRGHENNIQHMCTDNRRLTTLDTANTVYTWSLADMNSTISSQENSEVETVESIAISRRRYDPMLSSVLKIKDNEPVVFHSGEGYLVTGNKKGEITLYERKNGRFVYVRSDKLLDSEITVIKLHHSNIVAGFANGSVAVMTHMLEALVFPIHSDRVTACHIWDAVGEFTDCLVSSSLDGNVSFLNLITNDIVAHDFESPVIAMDMFRNRAFAVAGNGKLIVLDVMKQNVEKSFSPDKAKPGAPLNVSLFNDFAVICGSDSYVRVFDIQTGQVLCKISGHSGGIQSACLLIQQTNEGETQFFVVSVSCNSSVVQFNRLLESSKAFKTISAAMGIAQENTGITNDDVLYGIPSKNNEKIITPEKMQIALGPVRARIEGDMRRRMAEQEQSPSKPVDIALTLEDLNVSEPVDKKKVDDKWKAPSATVIGNLNEKSMIESPSNTKVHGNILAQMSILSDSALKTDKIDTVSELERDIEEPIEPISMPQPITELLINNPELVDENDDLSDIHSGHSEVEPLEQDSEPNVEIEEPVDPVIEVDEPTEPVIEVDEPIEPVVEVEESIEPVVEVDEIEEPVVTEEIAEDSEHTSDIDISVELKKTSEMLSTIDNLLNVDDESYSDLDDTLPPLMAQSMNDSQKFFRQLEDIPDDDNDDEKEDISEVSVKDPSDFEDNIGEMVDTIVSEVVDELSEQAKESIPTPEPEKTPTIDDTVPQFGNTSSRTLDVSVDNDDMVVLTNEPDLIFNGVTPPIIREETEEVIVLDEPEPEPIMEESIHVDPSYLTRSLSSIDVNQSVDVYKQSLNDFKNVFGGFVSGMKSIATGSEAMDREIIEQFTNVFSYVQDEMLHLSTELSRSQVISRPEPSKEEKLLENLSDRMLEKFMSKFENTMMTMRTSFSGASNTDEHDLTQIE
ncbi:hypothetical protein PCE1_001306 [Barthelona sp. PCE]